MFQPEYRETSEVYTTGGPGLLNRPPCWRAPSPEKAERWLKGSNRALGGRAPLEALKTEGGARLPECQRIGELWVRKESSPVLAVPSAVLPMETNYLINPHHPEADSIEVARAELFRFGERLLRLREEE